MPHPNVFEIRDLYCSYTRHKPESVLHIEHLDIRRGELIFLLGASGSGKSTLLETLGLMNNTIAGGDIIFYPEDGSEPISYQKLWNSGDDEKIADVRKSYLSFIFQNTNLMENFTAYENICLSQMIQKGVNQESAMQGAVELMNKVGLPKEDVAVNTSAVNLSGGQRQRVAFVRALNSTFAVLFGDEPTGNLDEKNANELVRIITGNIKSGSTAIIVSHDINLAMNHATRIICYTKKPGSKYNEISEANIFHRQYWEVMNEQEKIAFREEVLSLYQINNHKIPTAQEEKQPAKVKTNQKFRNLFLNKEGKALGGKGMLNYVIIIALLVFTFLAIGFANGSIRYLKEKLDNPFVLWLTITIPWGKADETSQMLKDLNNEELKAKYQYRLVTSYKEEPLRIYNPKDNRIFPVRSRSVDMSGDGDPIMKDIMDDKNRIKGTREGFRNAKDLSVIVTEQFLKEFNYDVNTPVIYMDATVSDTTGQGVKLKVPIAIRGVVREMPGKVQIAYSLYFFKAYHQHFGCTYDVRNKMQLQLVTFDDKEKANALKKAVQDFIAQPSKFSEHMPMASSVNGNYDFYNPAFDVKVSFDPALTYDSLDMFYKALVASPAMAKYKDDFIRYYDYYKFDEDFRDAVQFDALSINFSKLDKIRDFAYYFRSTFNDADDIKTGGSIEVDIGKVKEKENFYFLSNITKIISYLLIIFGAVSVGLFVFNILKSHLSKVRMNIGTFKAFGLHNNEAQIIYFTIILRFILVSIIVALGLAFAIGLGLNALLSAVIPAEQGVSYYRLFDNMTYVTIVIIILTGVLVSWFTIRRMLDKTPGDLIYNR